MTLDLRLKEAAPTGNKKRSVLLEKGPLLVSVYFLALVMVGQAHPTLITMHYLYFRVFDSPLSTLDFPF